MREFSRCPAIRALVLVLCLPIVISHSPLATLSRSAGSSSPIIVYAAGQNVTQPALLQMVKMDLQSYAPARVLISYTYTSSFNISQVSAIGKSLYRIVSGPTSIEFQAVDVDKYHFAVEISYAAQVEQSIQIATWSGSQAPNGLQISVKANVVRFDFTLIVTKEPQYPSVQEVAEAVVKQMSNSLQQFQVGQQKLVNQVSDTIVSIGTIAAIAFVLVVVLLIVVFRLYRRVAALSERGIG